MRNARKFTLTKNVIKKSDFRVFDIETTGLNPYKDKIFSFCIGDLNGNTTVHRIDGKNAENNKKILIDFFKDTKIKKIAHNYHFEYNFLKNAHNYIDGFYLPDETIWHDTMIMSQLLRNNAFSHALENICWEFCGFTKDIDRKVRLEAKLNGGYQFVNKKLMTEYQIFDGIRPALIFLVFYPEILKNTNLTLEYNNEINLVRITAEMEKTGIEINKFECVKLINFLNNKLNKCLIRTSEIFNEYINLKSEIQLENLILKILKLKVLKKSAKTGKPSFDKDVILQYREIYPEHREIFDLIVQTRSYTNALADIKTYMKLSDEENIIHPEIKTNEAKTGRQACANPNLQNVSKTGVLKNLFPVPARKCFKTKKDHLMLFVDYSGIEMRLIIDWCGNEELIEVLEKGLDIHSIMCESWYDKRFINEKDRKIKKELRGAGKNANFAVPYGVSIDKLAKILLLSKNEAMEGLNNFRKRFPKIANFSRLAMEKVRRKGFIETIFGRKLYIDPSKAYMAGNYLIQGTAAGILKRAEIKIDKFLKHKYNNEIKLVLPIHDELLIDFPIKFESKKDEFIKNISRIMVDIPEIKVPLSVEWKQTATNWHDAVEI